jgi:small GTP-binding protein
VTRQVEALPQLLSRLAAVVPDADGPAVEELVRRVGDQVLRVLVVGEAKRGKSTLINALLGLDVLPTGVVPLTAVTTTVVHGNDEGIRVHFADGTRERFALAALADYVTEAGNPANRRGVTDVLVELPAPALDPGVELVDTPGVGSVYAHNTHEATQALTRMDAAVFVLTVDPPISDSERALLRQVRDNAVRVFCVLNKIDRLSPDELREAQAFTERVLEDDLGQPVTVWPVSARAALHARSAATGGSAGSVAGFDSFSGALRGYLVESRTVDLTRSVATRAERLARGAAETAAATLAALSMSQQDLDRKLDTFAERLAAVRQDRSETQAIATSELHRLLSETNEQADTLRRDAEPALLAAVDAALDRTSGSTREIEQHALEDAAEAIRTTVDGWRRRRGKELGATLADLEHRLAQRLHTHIAAVRDAASSLFDLELPAAPTPVTLAGTATFSYRFTADPGQLDMLAAAMRYRLPAAIGRRQVATYVRNRAATLLDQHIGRARADFQYQLAETGRRFVAELDRRFDQAAGRIADAVSTAGRIRREHAGQVATLRQQASARHEVASDLADRFAAVHADLTATAGG